MQRCGCSYCGNGAAALKVMLTDFTGADRVYIACGYTDLRCGIDGLASLVQQQFQLDPFSNTLFLSVVDDGIESKHCIGRAMVSSFFTSDWSPAASSSLVRKVKQKP